MRILSHLIAFIYTWEIKLTEGSGQEASETFNTYSAKFNLSSGQMWIWSSGPFSAVTPFSKEQQSTGSQQPERKDPLFITHPSLSTNWNSSNRHTMWECYSPLLDLSGPFKTKHGSAGIVPSVQQPPGSLIVFTLLQSLRRIFSMWGLIWRSLFLPYRGFSKFWEIICQDFYWEELLRWWWCCVSDAVRVRWRTGPFSPPIVITVTSFEWFQWWCPTFSSWYNISHIFFSNSLHSLICKLIIELQNSR